MSSLRDTPNPLRPYYRPPSVSISSTPPGTTSAGTHGLGPKNSSAASYASSARDIFSDIDYTDYLSESSPSALDSAKRLVDDCFYRYLSVLLAQPFDVAKTVLQVRSQDSKDWSISAASLSRPQRSIYSESVYSDYPSDESDPDEPAYFTSAAPSNISRSPNRRRHRESISLPSTPEHPSAPTHQLLLKKPDSIVEVISQEWVKEGAWGVWKGSNTTFVYGILLQTIERWSHGLIAAVFNLPTTGLAFGLEASFDLVGSPYPWASLAVAISAAVCAEVILAPLDLIRTKLILTPTSTEKRSLASQLRTLNSCFCTTSLLMPTILHSLVTPTIARATPLLLRSYLAMDPVLTPNSFQMASLVSRVAELFVKLPLETVLRRAQMSVLQKATEAARNQGTWKADLETIVKVGDYRGIIGTMWWIVREEGTKEILPTKGKTSKGESKKTKGQGMSGLWMGWKLGLWGLAGIWVSRTLNGGSSASAREF